MSPFLVLWCKIHKRDNRYFLEQTSYVEAITELHLEATFDDFRTTRYKLVWISHKRIEILAAVPILSQLVKDNYESEDIKMINKLIQHMRTNPKDGLTFQKLNLETIRLVLYSDRSFSSNNDGSSQMGY